MKRIIYILVFILGLSSMVNAQNYKALWKQLEIAAQKDLPKTQIEVLNKIIRKAQKEKSYGNLLSAELMSSGLKTSITPDSMENELQRLKHKATVAEQSDKVLAAIYNCALGKIFFETCAANVKDKEKVAKDYFTKAMANPELLAKEKINDYVPLIERGKDDDLFGYDLLHVIGFEAKAYDVLEQYYLAHNNRTAACLTAYAKAEDDGAYKMSKLDALIEKYGDMPACCEIAWLKYDQLGEEVSNKQKFEYVQNALKRWGTWRRANLFKEEETNLQVSRISAYDILERIYAQKEGQVLRLSLRNIQNLKVKLIKTTLKGDFDDSNIKVSDIKKLSNKLVKGSEIVINRSYPASRAPYEEFEDSVELPKLSSGVYILSINSPTVQTNTDDQFLLYVSNLFVMGERLGKNKVRYVVVDAISGQPVANAKIKVSFYGKGKSNVSELVANRQGEVVCSITHDNQPKEIYVYTDADKGYPAKYLSPYFYYYDSDKQGLAAKLFTDRALYRPGQTVHVATVIYKDSLSGIKRTAMANYKGELQLFDANHQEVAKKEIITDEFGTASTDFTLPSSGLTGNFSIRLIGYVGEQTYFRVEEYKRPSFEVKFDDYKEKYKVGETIKVKGHAKTYSGIPVQGAKVSYTVTRAAMQWWYYWNDNNSTTEKVFEGEATTDDKGNFEAYVPFILSDDEMEALKAGEKIDDYYYNFKLNATVTDQAGESHEGYTSLPFSSKTTILTCDIPAKTLDTNNLTFRLNYLNAGGKEIVDTARYIIIRKNDKVKELSYKGKYTEVKANEMIEISNLSSGSYRLHAICGEDTVNADFVVFSLKDKRPVIKTHDWFYISNSQFPSDGKPIYVQVGSTDANQHVVYTFMAGEKIIEQGAFDQSNANTTRAFTYKSEYGNGLTVSYAWVKEGELYTHTEFISRPLPDTRLSMKWKTFRNKLIPGQQEEWTMSITDANGKPVKAQLMATLYDKSLDQIYNHLWGKFPSINLSKPNFNWTGSTYGTLFFNANGVYPNNKIGELNFSFFNEDYFTAFTQPYGIVYTMATRVGGVMPESKAAVKFTAPVVKEDNEQKAFSIVGQNNKLEEVVTIGYGGAKKKAPIPLRENLNETAFFYPQLLTDAEGNVSIKFTLPESLTTWRFMGLAHDKQMNNWLMTDEVEAKKTLMVQPNLPRFIRLGDEVSVSTRIINTSSQPLNTKVKLELVDPATEKVLLTQKKHVTVEANGTSSAMFSINEEVIKNFSKSNLSDFSLLVARISAIGGNFSDGEQQYLPILPNQEYVVNTYPITMDGISTEQVDLEKLLPSMGINNAKLTIEYTNNPSWLMIQALPYMAKARENDAISLMTAYYANALGSHIIGQSPKIKRIIEQWKREIGTETNLQSNLAKNQDLKTMVLNETPWVLDANSEGERKQQLINFFDENTLLGNQMGYINQLKKLQQEDGSFAWFSGMEGSLYMTVYIAKTLVRLQTLLGQGAFDNDQTSQLLKHAFTFLDTRIAREVIEMKKYEKKNKTTLFPSDDLCDYLYTNALAKRPTTADITYLIDRLAKKPTDLTIYGKANTAVILAQYGKTDLAKEYLKSLKEYTVATKEMGRYFDSRNAYYSWRNYKIPTEVAAIEALKVLSPSDNYIKEMQKWLLQEKRTQMWNTPINTTNAIWAFMNNGKWDMEEKTPAVFKLNGNVLEQPKATAGLGYVKVTTLITKQPKSLSIEKQSEGTSFGGVYAQFFQKATDIKEATSGISVVREVLDQNGDPINGKILKVGDKVKVRLTITASRDFDFVQVIDKRAACLEPTNQLSGYHWGYYIAPKDNSTNYYFDMLAKGKHIVEAEYFIDREGNYQTGTCTAQSAYAPEFSGRASAIEFKINK